MIRTDILSISCEMDLRWMPQDLTDEELTLVQEMAWQHQAITWSSVDPSARITYMASLGHEMFDILWFVCCGESSYMFGIQSISQFHDKWILNCSIRLISPQAIVTVREKWLHNGGINSMLMLLKGYPYWFLSVQFVRHQSIISHRSITTGDQSLLIWYLNSLFGLIEIHF